MIESPRPLSESGLWNLLARYYRERGMDCWRSGKVPYRITSNGYLADTYAAIVAAFLRDMKRDGVSERPVILEIGGGNAFFSWLLVNRLTRHHFAGQDPYPFDYLVTEAAERNVRAWLDIPRLRCLVDDGVLHMGVLEIDGPASGEVESIDGTRFDLRSRPVIVIANYLMDSLPTDLIRIRDQQVFRELVAIEIDPVAEDGLPTLAGLRTRYESHPAEPPYTGHVGVDAVIEEYRALPGEPCIPLPMLVVSFLETFLESTAPFLMLAGDLAYTTPDFRSEPPIVHDDYVAVTTNFHLLGRLFDQRGGSAHFGRHADSEFSVGAFLKPGDGGDLSLTREAASVSLTHFTPHDAHNIERALTRHSGSLDFSMVMAWLRLARCDAHVTALCLPLLTRIIEDGESFDRDQLLQALREGFHNELPEATGEDSLSTGIAFVLFKAGMFVEVLDFLDEAMEERGRTSVCLHVGAIASSRLGRDDDAQEMLDETLEADPAYWSAWPTTGDASLRDQILSEANDEVHRDYIVLRLSIAELFRADSTTGAGQA